MITVMTVMFMIIVDLSHNGRIPFIETKANKHEWPEAIKKPGYMVKDPHHQYYMPPSSIVSIPVQTWSDITTPDQVHIFIMISVSSIVKTFLLFSIRIHFTKRTARKAWGTTKLIPLFIIRWSPTHKKRERLEVINFKKLSNLGHRRLLEMTFYDFATHEVLINFYFYTVSL